MTHNRLHHPAVRPDRLRLHLAALLLVFGAATLAWAQTAAQPAPLEQGKVTRGPQQLELWPLLQSGGLLMYPIYAVAVLVVTVAFDRFLALRSSKIMPRPLLSAIEEWAVSPGGLDLPKAHRLIEQYPSPAAHMLRALLLKIGRPHAEVERAVTEASVRQGARLYSRVRWLNLSAAVAPLLGLLGTVWGMIRAFFDTTQLHAGENRADFLAEGIYIALVTTLGGLVVAIPAAILAHYFEGRIEAAIHRLDEMMLNFMPQIERFEGRRPAPPVDVAPPRVPPPRSPAVSEPLARSGSAPPK